MKGSLCAQKGQIKLPKLTLSERFIRYTTSNQSTKQIDDQITILAALSSNMNELPEAWEATQKVHFASEDKSWSSEAPSEASVWTE